MRQKSSHPTQKLLRIALVATGISLLLPIGSIYLAQRYDIKSDTTAKAKAAQDYRICRTLPELSGRWDCELAAIESLNLRKLSYKPCSSFTEPTRSACYLERAKNNNYRDCAQIEDNELSRRCHYRSLVLDTRRDVYSTVLKEAFITIFGLLFFFALSIALFKRSTGRKLPLKTGLFCTGLGGVIIQNLESYNAFGLITAHSTFTKALACSLYECDGGGSWLFSFPSGLGIYTYTLFIPTLYLVLYLVADRLNHLLEQHSKKKTAQ